MQGKERVFAAMSKGNEGMDLIHKSIATQAETLKKLALKIHDHPELGYEEKKACAWQTALLQRWRFRVQTPWCDMDTAYRADLGEGRPVFCFLAEYDALPGIGHGCGHNLICTAALGAAYALAQTLKSEKRKGRVMVMGTPAEESKGGKVKIVAGGGMQGVDAVLMAHPSFRTVPDTGCTAVQRFRIAFKGQSAHAAAAPEHGRNALDAVLILFQGVNAWRQQMAESSRIHGVVREGGVLPNIIPDAAMCEFYLRSPEDRVLRAMVARFRKMIRGAALMTDTEAIVEPMLEPYKARWPNATLNRLYVEAAGELGLHPQMPEHPGRGSSDFGDVSQKAPGAHVYFGIASTSIPGHSSVFSEAARTPYALDQMLKAAEAMARVGYAYLTDRETRREAKQNFLRDRQRRQ